MATAKIHGTSEQRGGKPAVVKKYANRRLYNTATSSYVTLEELSRMIREGIDFVVYDAKTGEDITRSVLTQIILEEDGKGRNLLPISFLRQLISFYDDSLHAFVPRYLELSMENFTRNQEQIRAYIEKTFGRFFPVPEFEDMARQNMALFQRAATMFTPFPNQPPQSGGRESGGREGGDHAPGDEGQPPPSQDEVRELREKVEALQRQLEQLTGERPDSGKE